MRSLSSCCLGLVLIVGILFPCLSTTATAAVPKLLNFQGVLTDTAGNPVTTAVNVAFTLWDEPVGGAALWTEKQKVTPDAGGRFNTLLGTVNPIPATVFRYSHEFLGIAIESGPEMTPRAPIASVGYAHRVMTVDGASGGTITSTLSVADSVGIGTITPSARLDVAGDALINDKVTVGPGQINTGTNAFVTGANNVVRGNYAVIAGGGGATAGDSNAALGTWSAIGGGTKNIASGTAPTIGGGSGNTATDYGTVGGGYQNTAGFEAVVGGGNTNEATGMFSAVGGGEKNKARGTLSVIAGGGSTSSADSNAASGMQSTIGGGYANLATGDGAAVGGGGHNHAFGINSVIAGGDTNTTGADGTTVGGGGQNHASAVFSTVAGGYANNAGGDEAAVGGGSQNNASGAYSAIPGGSANTVLGQYATVCGGQHNIVSGNRSNICGGSNNAVFGSYSCVLGGTADTIAKQWSNPRFSLAFGNNVRVKESYRFCLFNGDSSGALSINRDDRVATPSYGHPLPIIVGTNPSNGNGAYLTDGGTWTNASSRTFKDHFQVLDGEDVLAKLAQMPIEAWQYKGGNERHIGPVAEDFVAAFDVGTIREDGTRENKYLSYGDVAGIALAAIQELHRTTGQLDERTRQLETKTAEIENLNAKLVRLQQAVNELATKVQ